MLKGEARSSKASIDCGVLLFNDAVLDYSRIRRVHDDVIHRRHDGRKALRELTAVGIGVDLGGMRANNLGKGPDVLFAWFGCTADRIQLEFSAVGNGIRWQQACHEEERKFVDPHDVQQLSYLCQWEIMKQCKLACEL